MTTQQEYIKRHAEIKEKLHILCSEKLGTAGKLAGCKTIGENIGASQQTVYNYVNGRIKDGYLAEAIYKELKKFKAKN